MIPILKILISVIILVIYHLILLQFLKLIKKINYKFLKTMILNNFHKNKIIIILKIIWIKTLLICIKIVLYMKKIKINIYKNILAKNIMLFRIKITKIIAQIQMIVMMLMMMMRMMKIQKQKVIPKQIANMNLNMTVIINHKKIVMRTLKMILKNMNQ